MHYYPNIPFFLMSTLKKIKLGSFYGFDILVEVDSEQENKDWPKMFENWLESQKNFAVEESKSKFGQNIYGR